MGNVVLNQIQDFNQALLIDLVDFAQMHMNGIVGSDQEACLCDLERLKTAVEFFAATLVVWDGSSEVIA